MGRTRRTFTAEEKLKVVMAVIQDGKAVSDVAKENNIHPNMILNWKKDFLENAAMILIGLAQTSLKKPVRYFYLDKYRKYPIFKVWTKSLW